MYEYASQPRYELNTKSKRNQKVEKKKSSLSSSACRVCDASEKRFGVGAAWKNIIVLKCYSFSQFFFCVNVF